jgi:glucose/arabinose dehydrogenase
MLTRVRAAVIAAAAIVPCARADLPPGFSRTLLAPWTEVGIVTSLGVLPDGRLITGDYYGLVMLVNPGHPATTLIQLTDVVAADDHGLLGLTIDPDFANNGYFYIFYTSTGPYDIVVRYTLAGTTVDPDSRVTIWHNPDLCPGASHHGGALNFGPDGNLYITTGEEFDNAMNAQTLANQHGKVLRLAPDGSIPPDNPFINTPGAQPAIWAFGLRNPYRARMDPVTGDLYIGDVGDGAYEEIDRLSPTAAGSNLGWPFAEGTQCNVSDCSSYTAPIFAYSHQDPAYADGGSACIVCGPVYRGTAFPPEYRGNLFYADWVNGWIRRLAFDASGAVVSDTLFDSGPSASSVTDMKAGPDGAIYYSTNNNGPVLTAGIYRISANGANQPPVVFADANPRRVDPGIAVQFTSAGTNDPDNGPQPLSYMWSFGDGQSSTDPSPTHTYSARGLYQAHLTVSDGADPTSSPLIPITVGHAPIPTIITPAPQTPYNAGDTISFSGSATDAEDGPLPASAFSWTITLVHLTHTHNVEGPIPGITSGSFEVPISGHDPENTHFRVDLTVTDSDGIPATTSVHLSPNLSPLSFDSFPAGIPVFIDGRALQTPRVYQSLVGFHHQISAQLMFTLNGVEYDFRQWSNGQPATFDYISPEGGDMLTAMYSGVCGTADFNCDGDVGTDQDIEAFFACLSGVCPPPPCTNSADFNGDGDIGTDQDIESFFRVLSGFPC